MSEQPNSGRRLLRAGSDHPAGKRKDQTRHYQNQTLATPRQGRITSNPDAPDPLFDHAPKRLKLSDDGQTSGQQPERKNAFVHRVTVNPIPDVPSSTRQYQLMSLQLGAAPLSFASDSQMHDRGRVDQSLQPYAALPRRGWGRCR